MKSPKPRLKKRYSPDSNLVTIIPELKVGTAFTESDVEMSDVEIAPCNRGTNTLTREQTTIIVVIALVCFYGAYIAHEWWTGDSFTPIQQFLERAIFMFIGWCIGASVTRSRGRPNR